MYSEEVLNKRFTELLSGKNSSKKLNICFIYYCFSISYVFNVTVTASAKYLKGNQTHSLIPFLFGTILALLEILAISSLFLSELIHFA